VQFHELHWFVLFYLVVKKVGGHNFHVYTHRLQKSTTMWQDEEHRKHENLRYICKCSFLEIYNEQITDLLEPSSTNLQVKSLITVLWVEVLQCLSAWKRFCEHQRAL
jgi:hypothetical protein